jgi:hypothetical protein
MPMAKRLFDLLLSLAGLLLLGLPVIQQMIGFGPVTSSP